MQERILFRGFHPDKQGTDAIMLNGATIKGEWIVWDMYGRVQKSLTSGLYGYRDYISNTDDFYFSEEAKPDAFIQETIGRLATQDKNGKDVFDGDKIRDKNGNVYEVQYDDIELKWKAAEDLQESNAYIDLNYVGLFGLISNKWDWLMK